MSPRPPDEDLTSGEALEIASLARRVTVLQRENAEFVSANDVLQSTTAISMTQRGDLEAHLKRLGEAVLGMLTVLSNNSLIVVKDGLLVPENISVQGLIPPGTNAEVEEVKRQLDQEVMMLRREFDVIKIKHQRASCDQQNKDRQIEDLNNQIKNQRENLLKINNEQMTLRADHKKTEEDLKVVEDRCNTLNSEKRNLEVTLNELTKLLQHEQRLMADILSAKSKAEEEFKKIKDIVAELNKKNFDLEAWISHQSRQNSDLAINVHGEHIDMSKLIAFKAQHANTTIDSGIYYDETKTHSLETTDEYYDYCGSQSTITTTDKYYDCSRPQSRSQSRSQATMTPDTYFDCGGSQATITPDKYYDYSGPPQAASKATIDEYYDYIGDQDHIATTDKYYDYSGPAANTMKRLSLDSLSKYFSFIDS